MRLRFLYHGIGGGGAQRANGANLGTLGDDLCFPCRGANGCIDSWDACPVVGTGEVAASSNTAKQRFADISPNCASKAKSMTPSGKIATTSPRCRIASRSTPQGENCAKIPIDNHGNKRGDHGYKSKKGPHGSIRLSRQAFHPCKW